MRNKTQYHRWEPSPADLSDLTPLRARALIATCFFEAQRETIARAKSTLGLPTTDAEIRASAEGSLRMAFSKISADYDAPTRETLHRAVESLVETSRAFGTPADIIEHHRRIIEAVLARL